MMIAAGRKNGPTATGLIAMIFDTIRQVTKKPVRRGKAGSAFQKAFSMRGELFLIFRIHANANSAAHCEIAVILHQRGPGHQRCRLK